MPKLTSGITLGAVNLLVITIVTCFDFKSWMILIPNVCYFDSMLLLHYCLLCNNSSLHLCEQRLGVVC